MLPVTDTNPQRCHRRSDAEEAEEGEADVLATSTSTHDAFVRERTDPGVDSDRVSRTGQEEHGW